VEAGAVTAVAVLPTHRRRGHLTRLMEAQLDHISAEGCPVAVLVAAEWGIYGRFGYGPATEACAWELDTATAAFTSPEVGTVELVEDPSALRDDIEALHDSMGARRPGVITRDGLVWDIIAGVTPPPGGDPHAARRRTAVWRPDGAARGRGPLPRRGPLGPQPSPGHGHRGRAVRPVAAGRAGAVAPPVLARLDRDGARRGTAGRRSPAAVAARRPGGRAAGPVRPRVGPSPRPPGCARGPPGGHGGASPWR
jgi:hypothetical protein